MTGNLAGSENQKGDGWRGETTRPPASPVSPDSADGDGSLVPSKSAESASVLTPRSPEIIQAIDAEASDDPLLILPPQGPGRDELLAAAARAEAARRLKGDSPENGPRVQFSLGNLMLAVSLASLGLGISAWAPVSIVSLVSGGAAILAIWLKWLAPEEEWLSAIFFATFVFYLGVVLRGLLETFAVEA